MRKTKREPDENAEQFFESVTIPPEWKFRKMANWDSTTGRVYEVYPGIFFRVFFDDIPKRGGICECNTRKREPVFNCLVSNKRSGQLNKWIENYLTEK